jgi:hypothetical protein
MTLDGEEIKPGVFIVNQFTAFGEARNKVMDEFEDDEEFDIDKLNLSEHLIEGIPFYDWVNNRAKQLTARLFVVDRMFNERGLAFTVCNTTNCPEPEIEGATRVHDTNCMAQINATITNRWEEDRDAEQIRELTQIYGPEVMSQIPPSGVKWRELFTSVGVSFESYRFFMLNSFKEAMIFNNIYGEQGTEPVSDEEWREAFAETHVRFRVLNTMRLSEETDDDEVNEKNAVLNAQMTEFMKELIEFYNSPPEGAVIGFNDLSLRLESFMRECSGCEEFMRNCICECLDCDELIDECVCPCDDCGECDDCLDCDDCGECAVCDPDSAESEPEASDEPDDECPEDCDCADCSDCDECGECERCAMADVFRMLEEDNDRFAEIPDEPESELDLVYTFIAGMLFDVAEFYEDETMYCILVRLDPLGNEGRNPDNRIKMIIELRAEGFTDRIIEAAESLAASGSMVMNDSVLAKHKPQRFVGLS